MRENALGLLKKTLIRETSF